MARPKKIKLTWWALHDVNNPVLHAMREGRDVAMCGGKPNRKSYEVRGPKTIERYKKCIRCEAQLDRIELMR